MFSLIGFKRIKFSEYSSEGFKGHPKSAGEFLGFGISGG